MNTDYGVKLICYVSINLGLMLVYLFYSTSPVALEIYESLSSHAKNAPELKLQIRFNNAQADADDWLLHGRTWSEERFSPLTQINHKNVSTLGLAWLFDMNSVRGLEATPIVRDGILFTTGTWSVVYAINAQTGKLMWKHDPEVPRSWSRKGCCDVVNRGVAVWADRVFLGAFDGRLIALDAETGKLLWEVSTIDRTKPATITGAPRVVNGKVIIGNGGAEFGVRGYVSAYDALSGELVWRIYTVPGSPDGPHEQPELEIAAKTWSRTGEWLETGGGGTVWDSLAFDPELNLLYVGTGNGAPHARHRRSPGGGDNLFLSSILALDADSGQMKWYYQTTPGDSWDYTATQHMILADLVIDGRERKVILQAPKNGFFYVLDRTDGELLSAEKYVTVNWASHIENGRPVETGQGDYSSEDKLVYPAELGGHNWHPMSFNPDTGLVYIPAQEKGWVHSPVNFYLFDFNVPHIEKLRENQPAVKEGGYLKAWDPVRQKLAWQVKNATFINGGTLSTAGRLVFQGTEDGYFNAYDALSGARLLHLFVGTGIMAPPVSYAIDGEQYIAVMAGFGGATLFMLDGAAAAMKYKNAGRLLVFKLNGTSVPLPPGITESPTALAPVVQQTGDESISKGEKLYVRFCGSCHGMFGSKSILPDLTRMAPEINTIFKHIVLDGVFEAKGMPGFADILDTGEVELIQRYLTHGSPGL